MVVIEVASVHTWLGQVYSAVEASGTLSARPRGPRPTAHPW